MVLLPIAIDDSLVNLTFTDVVGQQSFIMVQSRTQRAKGDPRDFLLQLGDAYHRQVWLLMNLTLVTVAILVCLSSNRSMRWKRIKRNWRIRLKRLLVWTSRFYLSLLDRSNFNVTNFKRSVLVGSTLIGVSILNYIAMNTLGTQLVLASHNLFESLTHLSQAPPGVRIVWSLAGYASSFFRDPKNDLANEVYRNHMELAILVDDKTMVDAFPVIFSSDNIVHFEAEWWWSFVRRVVCHFSNQFNQDTNKQIEFYEIKLNELKLTSFAYVMNRFLDQSIKNLINDR